MQDYQRFSFPGGITAEARRCWIPVGSSTCTWYYVREIYRLAYVKVVDLWNTTSVLAFTQDSGTVSLKVDRPIGIAAVYTYERTEARLPPPPPPPRGGTPGCLEGVNICPTHGYGTAIQKTSPSAEAGPAGSCDGQVTVTFRCNSPNCNVWIAPGPGTYTANQLQTCPTVNGVVTCNVPAGTTLIAGQLTIQQGEVQ